MGVIDALDETSSKVADNGEAYLKITKKYYELKVFQQLAIYSSAALKYAIYGILLTLGLIFFAVAAALAMGSYFDSPSIGFLIVGVVFMAFLVIVFYGRKKIEHKIIHKLSENFFDQ